MSLILGIRETYESIDISYNNTQIYWPRVKDLQTHEIFEDYQPYYRIVYKIKTPYTLKKYQILDVDSKDRLITLMDDETNEIREDL